jgi:hypothetical protein
MKYLKCYSEKFNLFNWRKKKNDKDIYKQSFDIREFCEDYLSYLLDNKDYTLIIDNFLDKKVNRFTLHLNNNTTTNNTWGYIKDNFLPFIEMFINEYKIDGNIVLWFSNDPSRPANIKVDTAVDNLLKDGDTISSSYIVTNIAFNIK